MVDGSRVLRAEDHAKRARLIQQRNALWGVDPGKQQAPPPTATLGLIETLRPVSERDALTGATTVDLTDTNFSRR
jgi:hypothetical protein